MVMVWLVCFYLLGFCFFWWRFCCRLVVLVFYFCVWCGFLRWIYCWYSCSFCGYVCVFLRLFVWFVFLVRFCVCVRYVWWVLLVFCVYLKICNVDILLVCEWFGCYKRWNWRIRFWIYDFGYRVKCIWLLF